MELNYLEIASLIGTIAFAISGITIGIKKHLDVMGVFIIAFLTSSGGGILRDVLLNQEQAIFTDQRTYANIIIIIAIFYVLKLRKKIDRLERKIIFRVSDSIGLVAFAISGSETAIMLDHGFMTVVTISFLTAVGGGIIRDVLVNEVPQVLTSGFYGSVAVLIGAFLYISDYYGIEKNITIPLVFLFGIFARYIAIKVNFNLPKL
jgi:uncharacterized membrane protein YeiH